MNAPDISTKVATDVSAFKGEDRDARHLIARASGPAMLVHASGKVIDHNPDASFWPKPWGRATPICAA
ncbi:hypothetical protein [Iodidimonas gelatinilytica]|uniref:hypothetical protein n=1 Tax=Iodidimonas gelatinilytica TaxID=1236966 RepID=UPI0012310EA3|nr:hypothetical protein [Iodidimonas gelatinilytica]